MIKSTYLISMTLFFLHSQAMDNCSISGFADVPDTETVTNYKTVLIMMRKIKKLESEEEPLIAPFIDTMKQSFKEHKISFPKDYRNNSHTFLNPLSCIFHNLPFTKECALNPLDRSHYRTKLKNKIKHLQNKHPEAYKALVKKMGSMRRESTSHKKHWKKEAVIRHIILTIPPVIPTPPSSSNTIPTTSDEKPDSDTETLTVFTPCFTQMT